MGWGERMIPGLAGFIRRDSPPRPDPRTRLMRPREARSHVVMRIIAGERKGHGLLAPEGQETRPTLGRVRESLFGILGARVIDARAADLFAGSGTLGLEALSRGALDCVFVEIAQAPRKSLEQNLAKLRYADRAAVVAKDAVKWATARTGEGERRGPGSEPRDLVFLDPPYDTIKWEDFLTALAGSPLLHPEAVVVVQSGRSEAVPAAAGTLIRSRTETYGKTALHFFDNTPG